MTDDRIAELLGWPRGRTNRDSSLMHRIRLFDAEPPAEAINQDIGCEAWVWDDVPF